MGTIATPVALEPPAAAPSDSRAKKRARDERYTDKLKKLTIDVRRDEVYTITTGILIRLARHAKIMVSTKRVKGGRSVDDIRRDIIAAWPPSCEAIRLQSAMPSRVGAERRVVVSVRCDT